jgi:hypothetical protein
LDSSYSSRERVNVINNNHGLEMILPRESEFGSHDSTGGAIKREPSRYNAFCWQVSLGIHDFN